MKIISENKRKNAALEAQKAMLENFAETFNRIKRDGDSQITESFHMPDGTPIGVDSMHRPVSRGSSNNIEEFKGDLEMGYYNISKQIESKISELRTEFDKNEDTIYKLEALMNETQRLTNHLTEIR